MPMRLVPLFTLASEASGALNRRASLTSIPPYLCFNALMLWAAHTFQRASWLHFCQYSNNLLFAKSTFFHGFLHFFLSSRSPVLSRPLFGVRSVPNDPNSSGLLLQNFPPGNQRCSCDIRLVVVEYRQNDLGRSAR
jgi:hypothetical protein